MRWPAWWVALLALLLTHGTPRAATYTSSSTPFEWVDSDKHDKIGHRTVPYKFNGGGSTGCGSVPPVTNDAISDDIPIGFTFTFGTTAHKTVRVQTNGRLQFGNTLCGYGTNSIGPPQTYPYLYPNASVNNTMKVFGVDLDPTNLTDSPNYPSASRRTTCRDLATCCVSVATIGEAPNRRFVVTWKNVPEWVSASNTSGSFDLQVILNENGTFIYQYGNIVHGGTGSAQIGWQLDTKDFEVLTFGASAEPPPNTAILFYVPSLSPLAEYRFEQGAWSPGGAGQVVDTSVGGRGGSATGLTQTTSNGRVCRGAAIPANTSAEAVDTIRTGVRFSDSGVNMLGQGSVMFWWRSASDWAGSGARSVQLLDATQTKGQWFSLSKTAAGTLFFEVTDSTGVVRSVESDVQKFPAGTKGSVSSAEGTLDDLRIYNFELTQGQVGGVTIQTYPCGSFTIDHFELRHLSWSGLACAPGTMTLVACANASCTSLYTQGVVATLVSTGAATLWDPAAGGSSIVIGFGQSSATCNFYTATGSASFSVTGTGVPVAENNRHTCNGPGGSCTWTSANGATSGTFSAHTAAAGAFAGGVATLSPVFTFAAPRTAPVSLVLRATDGEVSPAGSTEGGASIRSGRLRIPNVYGSELLALPVPIVAQYWNGTTYTTNMLDSCTVVPASAIAMGNCQKSLAACDSQLSPSGNLGFAAGRPTGGGLVLTRPGLGNAGSVDLTLNTGTTASGSTCVGASASAATAAGLPWLGVTAPARATFGVFKSPLIYGRENY